MEKGRCKYCGNNFTALFETYDAKALYYDLKDSFIKTRQGSVVGCFKCYPVKIIRPAEGRIYFKSNLPASRRFGAEKGGPS